MGRDGFALQVGRRQRTLFFFFFFFKREEKAQDLVDAVTLRSPTCQVQAANEEAEEARAGWRVRGEQDTSSLSSTRKDAEQSVSGVYVRFCTNTFSTRKKEKDGRMRARVLKRATRQREQDGEPCACWSVACSVFLNESV